MNESESKIVTLYKFAQIHLRSYLHILPVERRTLFKFADYRYNLCIGIPTFSCVCKTPISFFIRQWVFCKVATYTLNKHDQWVFTENGGKLELVSCTAKHYSELWQANSLIISVFFGSSCAIFNTWLWSSAYKYMYISHTP